MTPRYDTITFLSDFGSDDEFVGVVKAVLRGLAPHATVLDLTHGIPPFDMRAGGLALARAAQYLPSGVVLAVGQTERFNPAVEASRPLLVDPRFIEVHRLGTFPERSLDIDVVFDLMIHDLDLVLALAKAPVRSGTLKKASGD